MLKVGNEKFEGRKRRSFNVEKGWINHRARRHRQTPVLVLWNMEKRSCDLMVKLKYNI